MPSDRHEPRRAPTLPDGVVYWMGALWLAGTMAVRLLLLTDGALGWFLSRRVWAPIRRGMTNTAHEATGLVRRTTRAAPTWLAARRARLALLAGSVEVLARRTLRRIRVQLREDLAPLRAPAARRWGRRALGGGAVAGVLAVGLVLASGPLIEATAKVTVGDGVRDELLQLDQTSIVLASEGTPLGIVERERRRVVDTAALPSHVSALVLAAEDHRFEDHGGYDLEGLARAAVANARAGEVAQGGSTITQQLAKLNFTDGEESMARKVKELLYAVRLEDELTKEQLLERYLNQVYFGNGAHGIAAAAEEYFGVQPEELTPAQAAALAAVIQRPSELDPRTNPEGVQRRRDAILARAVEEGLLSRDQAATAVASPLELAPPAPRPRTDPILDAVRAEVRKIEQLGATPEARLEKLETGGLHVETTLDPVLQQTAAEAIGESFPEGADATAAMAAVDPQTGAIRALRSGRDGTGGFDLARQGRRQPGSTFKPLTAVAALEEGLSPDQGLVGDGPIELDHGGPEPWRVDNFDGADLGTVDLREALRSSVNTAFAQIGVAVGVDQIADVVEDALETGTGRAARIPYVPAFGKTGTSQDGADAWFVGSTSDLTTAVWVGHPESRVAMPEATGGALAAPIWRAVTSTWTATHPAEAWPAPTVDEATAPGLSLPRPQRAR